MTRTKLNFAGKGLGRKKNVFPQPWEMLINPGGGVSCREVRVKATNNGVPWYRE